MTMKKVGLSLLQIIVTVLLLIWVFHDPAQRHRMAVALRQADYRWIPLAVVSYVIVEVAAAFRWQVLMRVQGIQLNFRRTFALFFIGMFYNQFLPGGTGGDVIKSYLLLKETPRNKAGALLAVIFDRLIGLVALVTITGTLVLLRYRWLSKTPDTQHLLWLLLFLLGSAILGLITSFIISGFNLLHLLPKRFPAREKLIEVSEAYHLYAHHWRGTLFAFVASVIAHLMTFTMFLCVAYALRAGVHVVDFFAIMPIERTISSLPISFGGAGWRELILQIMLSNLCGVPVEKAKLIGSLGFLIILLCSLPGGIVYFLYKPSGLPHHVPLCEMESEVATLEHEIGRGE